MAWFLVFTYIVGVAVVFKYVYKGDKEDDVQDSIIIASFLWPLAVAIGIVMAIDAAIKKAVEIVLKVFN